MDWHKETIVGNREMQENPFIRRLKKRHSPGQLNEQKPKKNINIGIEKMLPRLYNKRFRIRQMK